MFRQFLGTVRMPYSPGGGYVTEADLQLPVYRIHVPIDLVDCVVGQYDNGADLINVRCSQTNGVGGGALSALFGVLFGAPAGAAVLVPAGVTVIACEDLRRDLAAFARELAGKKTECIADGATGISYDVTMHPRRPNASPVESYVDITATNLACTIPDATGSRTLSKVDPRPRFTATAYSATDVVDPPAPPPGHYDLVVDSTDERTCVGAEQICAKAAYRPVVHTARSMQSVHLNPAVEQGRRVVAKATVTAQPGCVAPPRPPDHFSHHAAKISVDDYFGRYAGDTLPWRDGTTRVSHHYVCSPGTGLGAWYTSTQSEKPSLRKRP